MKYWVNLMICQWGIGEIGGIGVEEFYFNPYIGHFVNFYDLTSALG
ncbi:hypothetical protein LYNGBM3L_66620 [Moorena producens 3L]|uniref:Uncharacterized protein n=1 Tax=Moorena producens 3L TaxID=489825 RepID=F4Y1L9_9CYAN|nr:hypothetical protein LYNGBM3L_66620 [Moorena producens 3L]